MYLLQTDYNIWIPHTNHAKYALMTIAFNDRTGKHFLPLPTSEMMASISEVTGTSVAKSTARDDQRIGSPA
jgi:hypothetical protein